MFSRPIPHIIAFLFCASLILLKPTTSFGYVVFDSIEPGKLTGPGATINGNSYYGQYSSIAAQFTPSQSGVVTSIEFPAWYWGSFHPALPALVDVSVIPFGPGDAPTQNRLTEGTVSIAAHSVQTPSPLTTFYPSAPVTLIAGAQYWLLLEPHDSFCSVGWTYSSETIGLVSWNPTPTTWRTVSTTLPEFRVNAVPEPAFSALMLLGFGLLIRQRSKNGSGS